jgi:hypothetical protein
MRAGMSERRTHRNLFAVVSGSTRDNVMDRKIIQQYAHLSQIFGVEVKNTRDGLKHEALRMKWRHAYRCLGAEFLC